MSDSLKQDLHMAKKLSDLLLRSGFVPLRAMPGHEREASEGARAPASHVQILCAPETPGYIVRVIPKNALWENAFTVSFVENKGKTRVAVSTNRHTVHLGEDPSFKILLHQVVQSIAEVIKA